MVNTKRQTGRSTRMMLEAISYARGGGAAHIVAGTDDAVIEMGMELVKAIPSGDVVRVKAGAVVFNGGGSIVITGNIEGKFIDIRGGRVVGRPHTRLFVDHNAIESHFAWMLQELYEYDEPGAASGLDSERDAIIMMLTELNSEASLESHLMVGAIQSNIIMAAIKRIKENHHRQ